MKRILLWFVIGISALVAAIALFIYLSLPDVTNLQSKNPPTTALMVQRYREAQKSGQKFQLRQQWVGFVGRCSGRFTCSCRILAGVQKTLKEFSR